MSYTSTLNRLPDDIVLAVSTRDLRLGSPQSCLCGWAIREEIARVVGCDAETVWPYGDAVRAAIGAGGVLSGCVARFGGTEGEWLRIFEGVAIPLCLPAIETAWVQRLDKAVRRA